VVLNTTLMAVSPSRAKAKGEGGQSATEADERGSARKAKQEMPEAPDAIGFQDERGGKGHS